MRDAGRTGVLGGTFDPIHRGHLDVAEAAQGALHLARVILMPSSVPPHRAQPATSSYHRFAMTAFAVAGRPGWAVSDLELCGPAPSFTSTTLQQLHRAGYLAHDLFFLIGADAFADIATWRDYPEILTRAHFAVVSRPGFPVADLPDRLPSLRPHMTTSPADLHTTPMIVLIDAPTADVSSTAIRNRCAGGASIDGMVHPAVRQHIEQHGLYTSNAPRRRADDATRTAGAGRLHGEG